MSVCVNCSAESSGNFCPNCGQNLNAKGISLKAIASEFTDKWIGLDTKFGRTVRDLTVRPQTLITEYLNRNTVKYVGPLGYFVVVTAVMLLVFDLTGFSAEDFMTTTQNSMGFDDQKYSDKQLEFQQLVMSKLASNFRILSGLLAPFQALGLWLFFRRLHNYVEHLAISLYLQAHLVWVTILTSIVFIVFSVDLTKLSVLISFLYFIVSTGVVFRNRSRYSYLKVVASWILGFLLFILFVSAISVFYVVKFL